jgi:hypothetical protein
MVERFNEKANALALEYWRLKQIITDEAGENRLAEIEKLLEKGIGGKLREQLEAEAKRLRKQRDDRASAAMSLDEVKAGLLELTAELAPNLDLFADNFFPYDSEHEPISEEYFKALTEIFFGEPQSRIQFRVATFSPEGIRLSLTDAGSPFETLGYALMIIQETAKKMLGMENSIDTCCELLRGNEYAFIVLKTLLTAGRSLRLEELKGIAHREDKEYKELMSDLYDKELVNGLKYLLSDEWEYKLIKELNGAYDMTDLGASVWCFCNAEFGTEAGEEKLRRASISNSGLNIHKILKFLRR